MSAVDLEAVGRRLGERAEAEGLLDAAFARVESPLGTLVAVATDGGLARLVLPGIDEEVALAELSASIGSRLLERPGRFDELRRELDEYFEGDRRRFDLALDRRLIRGFARAVLAETSRIPYGQTRSYAEVAALAGSPRAHRAAGSALGANPLPLVIPCHRVLRRGGALGGYGGGLAMKRALLVLEGII